MCLNQARRVSATHCSPNLSQERSWASALALWSSSSSCSSLGRGRSGAIDLDWAMQGQRVRGHAVNLLTTSSLMLGYPTRPPRSIAFSPFVTVWFFSIAAIGLYNIIRYDASCFAALSPHYIYYYWKVGRLEGGERRQGHTRPEHDCYLAVIRPCNLVDEGRVTTLSFRATMCRRREHTLAGSSWAPSHCPSPEPKPSLRILVRAVRRRGAGSGVSKAFEHGWLQRETGLGVSRGSNDTPSTKAPCTCELTFLHFFTS